jgi:hypothetical protein
MKAKIVDVHPFNVLNASSVKTPKIDCKGDEIDDNNRNPGFVVLLDEARAVRCAREMGLPVLRAVGLLLHAQAQGHLESVKPALDQLRTSGFRLSESVYQAALRQAGESS